mmetsp:Transcript_36249/g.96331  ORF Transcript_36249/g.96331 Transcript_36249/m.96331 type:complete len:365 (+) Transcript_36249:2427-3521(+)
MVEIARSVEVDTPLAMCVLVSSIRILQCCDHCLLDLVPIFYCQIDPQKKHVEKGEQEKEEEHLDAVGRFLILVLVHVLVHLVRDCGVLALQRGVSDFRPLDFSLLSVVLCLLHLPSEWHPCAQPRDERDLPFPTSATVPLPFHVLTLYVRHHHLRLIIVRVIDDGIEHLHRDEEKEQEERIEEEWFQGGRDAAERAGIAEEHEKTTDQGVTTRCEIGRIRGEVRQREGPAPDKDHKHEGNVADHGRSRRRQGLKEQPALILRRAGELQQPEAQGESGKRGGPQVVSETGKLCNDLGIGRKLLAATVVCCLQNFGKFRFVDKPERERQDARANGKEIEICRRGKEELVVKFVKAAKQKEEVDDGT